ncbi:unnamed protein product, partial [Amoebophrya sp. A25]
VLEVLEWNQGRAERHHGTRKNIAASKDDRDQPSVEEKSRGSPDASRYFRLQEEEKEKSLTARNSALERENARPRHT